jgi:ABC-type nitrate/sulfonate/bicarbonate transport system substrate-binding protein
MCGHSYATWNMPVEQATVRDVVTLDGGKFDDVRLVPYEVDDEVAGLRAHMFDSVWVYEAWAVQNAAVQGMAVNYFPFTGITPVFDYYTPVIAANDDFAKANPDVVRAFLKATRRGYELAVQSPTEAAECLLQAVPELSRDLVVRSQEFLASRYVDDAPVWGWIDSARWARFYQWLDDSNLVERHIEPTAGFTCEYLEQS